MLNNCLQRHTRQSLMPRTQKPPELPEPARKESLEQSVLRQFRIVFAAIRAHFQQVEQAVGLGGAQAWLLSVIADQPGIDTQALPDQMKTRPVIVNQALKSLQKRGLVQIDASMSDPNTWHVSLSTTGKTLVSRIPQPPTGVLPVALQALNPDSLGQLEAGLEKLIEALSADPRTGDIPLAEL